MNCPGNGFSFSQLFEAIKAVQNQNVTYQQALHFLTDLNNHGVINALQYWTDELNNKKYFDNFLLAIEKSMTYKG
jgi:hypothetical protein